MPRTAKIKTNGSEIEAPTNGPPEADRETFHYFVGLIDREDVAVKAAQKVRKEVRRRASDAGINLEILDLVRRKRDKEPETAGGWMAGLLSAFKWMGITAPVQMEMFEDDAKKRSATERAEMEGRIDGLEGRDPSGDRYDAASDTGQARLRGWNAGQKVIQERFLAAQQP